MVKLGALPQLVALLDWSKGHNSSAQQTTALPCNLLCLLAAEPACKASFSEGGMLQGVLVQLHASDASGEPAIYVANLNAHKLCGHIC